MLTKFTALSVLFCSFAFADISFLKYEDALKEAKKTDKIIALTVVSTTCPWCHKMLKETLKNKRVEDAINKEFLYVVINKDTTPLPDNISARLVPTTFFLDKNGKKIVQPAIGFWTSDDFISFLNDASKAHKK